MIVSDLPDVQDPDNDSEQPMSEPAPHTATKRHCFSRGAPLAGMPNADWIFRVGTEEKSEQTHSPYLQFCLQLIKLMLSHCSNKGLAEAYKTACVCGGGDWNILQL